ncbi:SAM-dependent DNA methyltransferase [Microbacteriaceae bacterium]|nr:SAM-dependent DNA methyltransferase [Candidatus Saccharibacteria bacterium]
MAEPKNQAALIWNIADILRGGWKQYEYQDVILPLVVLKRLDSVLAGNKQNVLRTYNQMQGTMSDDSLALFLEKEAGYKFYNTSPYDFKKLLDDSEGIYANFINYMDGFSPNVRDVITKFDFQKQLNKLKGGKILHLVLKELDKVDLGPDAVSNHDMGYIFEELIRKFNEQSNETAGEHYTPREVIRLMVRLLLQPDEARIKGENKILEMYDPACGTGGMLTIGKEYIQDNINPDAEVFLYGQELNPQTFAIAKSDLLIKGEDANRIKGGSGEHAEDSTLSNDQFYDKAFDYVIANPPYGTDWKKDKDAVEAEAARGDAGRFPAGTPAVSDGQMLFLQHMVSKIRPVHEGGGRVAVVHNGSALFTGNAGSGPSNIRKWLLEGDLLEAIIALPTNMFYNTGISTYIWVLTNRKEESRKGKVQLIDGSSIFHKLRKNLGDKNKELSDDDISEIYELYQKFRQTKRSQIFDNDAFGYTQVTVTWDANGKKEKDTENIPLNEDIDEYFKREVLPHIPNAKLDRKKDKIGYEIPFNRYFYEYIPPRDLDEIDDDLQSVTKEILALLNEVTN